VDSGIKLTQAANYMGVQNTIGFKINDAQPMQQQQYSGMGGQQVFDDSTNLQARPVNQ